MAKILYAAAGDGYGHATRVHSVGAGLLERGHDVLFLTSHKTKAYLSPRFPGRVQEVLGLLTAYCDGRVQPWKTLTNNAKEAWRSLVASIHSVRHLFKEFGPDLVISDFEPFAPFWALRLGVPFISLDNQHLLTHAELEFPRGFVFDRWTAYATIRLFYTGARRYLITSFIPARIRHQPAAVVPPVLRAEVHEKQSHEGGFLLAYKGAGGENQSLRAALEQCEEVPIRAYGFGEAGRRDHIEFKAFDANVFLDDLAGCVGVVATAGHSLVSECIQLEKPMLLVPIRRQYEQIINAHYVRKLGFGEFADRLSRRAIQSLLVRLDNYRRALRAAPKVRLSTVLDAVEREIP